MEKEIKSVQAINLPRIKNGKVNEIKIMGMSLPVYLIAALITGSILGMNRDLLKKAAVRFLSISFLSMACAILMAGLMGIITGLVLDRRSFTLHFQ